MRLTYPDNAVVAVAGLPGDRKSTLIDRAVDRSAVRVVDTDDQRRGGGRASNVRHYGHIVTAVWGRRPIVIHSRGTLGTLRRAITLLSSLRGRPPHLTLLDAPREAAGVPRRRPRAYNGTRTNPWGRQASTWSVRGGGCESRCRRPRKTPAKTQVRSLTTSRSLPSTN